jgi:hypothetical protein
VERIEVSDAVNAENNRFAVYDESPVSLLQGCLKIHG